MAINWAEAQDAAKAKVVAAPINPTKTTHFTPAQFAKLCKAIEQTYADLRPDTDAVAKAGVGKDQMSIKLAVYSRRKAGSQPGANVTLYRSGTCVWTNLEPVAL